MGAWRLVSLPRGRHRSSLGRMNRLKQTRSCAVQAQVTEGTVALSPLSQITLAGGGHPPGHAAHKDAHVARN